MATSEKTVITLKTDRKIKEKAQKTAKELGMPLGTILNAYLNQFVKTKEVYFSVYEGNETWDNLRPEVKKRLVAIEKDIKNGKNMSPRFSNTKDAIAWLKS